MGKSTLFNRLTQSRQAIVNDEAGTTRDRQYGKVNWVGHEFSIVDTGGWVVNSDDIFEEEINKQVAIAIEEADVILFVVDATHGITDLDDKVAAILRRSKNELLDATIALFPTKVTEEELEEEIPRIAVVGRPNAGKSSIINAFIGEDRYIVTDIAGTTRDSVNTRYNKFGFDFYIIDTAGIRKKGKVNEDIEYYSVIRSIRAIENSDVCILMIDATRGIESQDLNIFSLIQKNKKGLVVCINKWDLVEDKSTQAIKTFENAIRARLAPFTDFPIVYASALTKQRIFKVLECASEVYKNRHRHVPTARLNEEMLAVIENYPPPANKGKYVKIKYVTQLKGTPVPTFIFFCNLPQWVKDPYKHFLENKIRDKWNFTGTPINIIIREK